METKHEKFVRLAAARLEKAVHAISLIENLASANYEYSEDEAWQVVHELTSAVSKVRAEFGLEKFSSPPPPPPPPPVIGETHDDFQLPNTTETENLELIRIGPRLSAAIEADSRDEAKLILLGLLTS